MSEGSSSSARAEYALTPMQRGMLFETLHSEQPGVNVQQVVVRLPEDVHAAHMREAWTLASERHESLRAAFQWRGRATPTLVVHDPAALDFETLDWRDRDAPARDVALSDLLEQDRARGVALDAPRTMRWKLVQHGHREWVLVWTFHHALLDGRGFTLVLSEVLEDYDRLTDGTFGPRAPAPSPRVHVEALARLDPSAAAAHFRAELRGLEQPTRIALTRPSEGDPHGGLSAHREHEVRLPEDAVARLRQRADEAAVTFFTCVQAAWAILLARYARSEDVVFGVTRAGRHLVPEAPAIAGCLINTVPQRAQVRSSQPLVELLQRLRQASLSVRAFEHTPLVDIQRASAVPASEPLLTTNLVLERYLLQSQLQRRGGAWSSRRVDVLEQSSFPLSVAAYLDGSLLIRLEYDPRAYAETSIEAMAGQLLQLLLDISHATLVAGAGRPRTSVGDVRTLSDADGAALLRATAPERPLELQQETYVQRFRRRARDTPDVTAVTTVPHGAPGGAQGALTYAQLDRRSDRLAARLVALGVRRHDRVAVCLPRSLAMAEAVLAVLKAGAAYVPLDASYPRESLAYMLTDSGARALISARPLGDSGAGAALPRVDLDLAVDGAVDEPPLSAPADPPRVEHGVEDLAYVIYTSGSTGHPKGVMVTHRAVVAHNLALSALFELTARDRVLQFASFSFDVSVEEMLPTWLSGATLVLRSPAMSESVSEFLAAVEGAQVTVLNLPTAFWHELVRGMDERGARLPASVRLVVVGGERASARAYATWRRLAPGVRWLNGYGPTEATITCSVYDSARAHALAPHDEVPIGRPTGHARLYVLDERLRLVPRGVPAQLYAAGPCVARGYLGQEELTAQRFLDDPFAPGERMYATGDLVRWSPALQLEFLGRMDRQVKLRGFRVEPGEIEAVLERHPLVQAAVVAVRPDASGRPQLCAWVQCSAEPPVEPQALKQHVRASLPAFMTPSSVAVLRDFPMTPGDKVDVAALPVPTRSAAPVGAPSQPRHDTDVQLCALFAEALELAYVAPSDSFYDLGGHSLLAVRLLDRVNDVFGAKLTLGTLKEADTPADLADRLLGPAGAPSLESIYPIQPRGSLPPLFAVHVLGGNGSYFAPLARALGCEQPVIGVTSPPRPGALPRSVEEIAAGYARDILRYAPSGPLALAAVSLGGVVAVELARQLQAAGRDVVFVGLFDALGPGPLETLRGLARVGRHVQELRAQGPRYATSKLVERSRRARRQLRVLELRARRRLGRAVSDDLVALEFIERNVQVALAHELLPYEGRLTVLRATDNVFYTDAYRRSGLGWGGVGRAGVDVIDVPGEHLSMLEPPHVDALASALRAALARAVGG